MLHGASARNSIDLYLPERQLASAYEMAQFTKMSKEKKIDEVQSTLATSRCSRVMFLTTRGMAV